MVKACSRCGVSYPLDNFRKSSDRCKLCVSEYNREYAKPRRSNADFMQANREKSLRYYHRNTASCAAYSAKHHQDNIDKIHAQWQTPESKEWRRLYCRQWRLANPDKNKEIVHRGRAARRGSVGSFTAEEWVSLKLAHGNVCLRCGLPESERPLTVDHILPVSKGGSSDIGNIQPLCGPCNSAKNNRYLDYRGGPCEQHSSKRPLGR